MGDLDDMVRLPAGGCGVLWGMALPRVLLVLPAVLGALLAGAPAAGAAANQLMFFEAPRELLDPATRPRALAELDALGVRAVRVVVTWRDVAPSPDAADRPGVDLADPASYRWGEYAALVGAARARGWTVLATLSGPVPRWATPGGRDTTTRPDPTAFGRFATAAARRLGRRVDLWSVWNEPNLPRFLTPQFDARGRPASPGIYRGLYRAAVRGLRAGGAGDRRVLLGETAPRGSDRAVAPLAFLRGALCLDARGRRRPGCARLRVGGVAHHPYAPRQGPGFVPRARDDVTIGVLGRLFSLLDRAARAGVLAPRTPVYLTEFGVESLPDTLRGVSLARQAEDRSLAERIAFEHPRVRSMAQYLLRDDPARADAPALARYSGFQSGLRTAAGRAKPALAGFRLPLAARRAGRRASLWGLVRPARGRVEVTVQAADGRGWRPVRRVRTDGGGVLRLRTAAPPGRRWRTVWRAPDGTVHRSAPVRAR
jgi:hypothetical protein